MNEEIKMKRTAALECVHAFDSSELSARYNSGAGSYEAVRQYLLDCCWKFGTNRVNMILARTVLYKNWDGRFTSDVRKWANENAGKVSRLMEYALNDHEFVCTMHPAILNDVIRQKMQIDREKQKNDMER